MKINTLKISLIISIIGIFLLLLLSNILEPKIISIKNINERMLNQQVKVSGQVNRIKSFEESNFQIISLKDETGKIDITASKILNLTTNQTISVIGTITEYNNTLQIQADKIILE